MFKVIRDFEDYDKTKYKRGDTYMSENAYKYTNLLRYGFIAYDTVNALEAEISKRKKNTKVELANKL